MNKAEWTDFFFFIKDLFRLDKSRKVEMIERSSNTLDSNKDEDSFKTNNENSYYGKKRKKYSDYLN